SVPSVPSVAKPFRWASAASASCQGRTALLSRTMGLDILFPILLDGGLGGAELDLAALLERARHGHDRLLGRFHVPEACRPCVLQVFPQPRPGALRDAAV